MEMFIDDISALINHLKIEKRIHLCGISMGGMIAQNYILKYPETVKTLILCATAAKHDPTQVIESQRIMDKYDLEAKFKTRVGALYSRPFRRKLKKDNEVYDKLKKDFMEDPTRLQDWFNQAASFSTHDTTDRLHLITHPTLILTGDEDRIILPTEEYGTDFIHENIPNSTLKIIDTTGHGFVSEAPEKVNKIIWNFIKEHISR
jgi:pimeloyl-ACP methyl ester carboxylesterase